MKPEILVLSSSASYIALNLEKDLKDRPFTRLGDLEEYIGSERRRRPFLLIMEVANPDDVDRALIAYEWAETVDPQGPARFLILAAKHITFDDRQARLRGLELALLPVNNRNLLFKVDLQLKLLLAAAESAGQRASANSKPGSGFTAELASLPGKPGRVMVLRGPERGGWKKEVVPGAKVRWRWIDEDGAGAATPADLGAKITWAAESAEAPVRDVALAAWVLSGEDADVKAFQNDKELISGRKLLFEKEAAAGRAADEIPAALSAKAPPFAEQIFKKSQFNEEAGQDRSQVSGGANLPTEQIEVNLKPSAEQALDRAQDFRAPGEKTPALAEKVTPDAASAADKIDGANGAASPRASDAAGFNRESSAAPGKLVENKNSLDRSAPAAVPGNARVAPPARVEPGPKATVGEGAGPRSPAETALAPEEKRVSSGNSDEAAAPAGERPAATPNEKIRPANDGSFPVGHEKRVSSLGENPAAEEVKSVKPKFRASAFEATLAPSTKIESYGTGIGGKRAEKGNAATRVAPAPAGEAPAPAPALKNVEEGSGSISAAAHSTAKSSEPAAAVSAAQNSEADQENAILRGTAPTAEFSLRLERESAENAVVKSRPERQASDPETRLKGAAPRALEELRVKGHTEARGEEGAVAGRAFFLVSLADLGDQNSSWQPASSYRIYLSARHRYYGFRHETELFPLWVYQGELAPEFLEREAVWRFYDRKPSPYFTRAELPAGLAEELFRLMPAAVGEETKVKPTVAAGGPKVVPAATSSVTASPAAPAEVATPGVFQSILAVIKRLLGRA